MYNLTERITMNTKAGEVHILIVDDEPDIREILSFNLEHEGYNVDTAVSAEEALRLLRPDHSLLLLDVMMSGMSGFKLADRLRKDGNSIPIIFLTAKKTENDLLTGFSIGGDDFITKPFSVKEVIARVRSVLKRGRIASPEVITAGKLTLDTRTKTVAIAGEKVELTRTEYNILHLLLKREREFFPRSYILAKAWNNDTVVLERTVDVHMARLRKKLGPCSECIISRIGYGYAFDSDLSLE
ncbi:MAG: response regulator transcription factor [Tannerellaceae bacterium]|jgi:DNA-binding response OmpR family regulator|nr:response regulator transcription factor [Tannerellaceae bacterium]